jgi:hypothetical protein
VASHSSGQPRQVYGVDFSGAAKAGKKIWITQGVIEGEALRIEACHQAADLPGSSVERARCLAALRDFVRQETAGAFGFDFPFGLPRELVEEDTWQDFVVSFPDRYAGPESFRQTCRTAFDGSELKRVTDRETKTPFSVYNIRLYRQTYYGIRDLLAPLVHNGLACVLPMQTAASDKPWVLEICPASTLKQLGLYRPYKGKSGEHVAGRTHILQAIEEITPLPVPTLLRSEILEDAGGDALDSVVAAFAVFRALSDARDLVPEDKGAYALEGYVYA